MKCYLCGRYKNRCQCFTTGRGKQIARSFQRKIFCKIPPKVKKSEIQTPLDTKDMTAYIRQVNHNMKFEFLWPTAYTWRHFSNEFFWQALMDIGAVPVNDEPNWGKVRKVMTIFQDQGKSWFGGVFYSGNVLLKFRYCDFSAEQPEKTPWKDCTQEGMTSIEKEIQALKLVYYVARSLQTTFRKLQRQPDRTLWKRATETFMHRINLSTQGMFAHYSMKIALDGILLSAPHLEHVVSWWPMLCKAYMQNLSKMYTEAGKTSQNDLMYAGVHFHRQLQSALKCSTMKLKCALAQTCWILCRSMHWVLYVQRRISVAQSFSVAQSLYQGSASLKAPRSAFWVHQGSASVKAFAVQQSIARQKVLIVQGTACMAMRWRRVLRLTHHVIR